MLNPPQQDKLQNASTGMEICGLKRSRLPNPNRHSWIYQWTTNTEATSPKSLYQKVIFNRRSSEMLWPDRSAVHKVISKLAAYPWIFTSNWELARIPSFWKSCIPFLSPLWSDVSSNFHLYFSLPEYVCPVFLLLGVSDRWVPHICHVFWSLWTLTLFPSLDSSFTLVWNLKSHGAFALF